MPKEKRKRIVRRDKDNDISDGYPLYPVKEDIYNRDKEEEDLDPENPSEKKTPNEEDSLINEKNFEEDVSGGDLDMEETKGNITAVNEDEENDYYSLGGDNHNELDEYTGKE